MPEPFDYDAYGAELDLSPFRFTLAGQPRELPHFSTLTAAQGIAIEEGHLRETLADLAGDELADLLLTTPGFKLNKILEDWERHAQIKPGEGKASSRS